MVLKTWMSTARMRLEDLKRLSEDDMQNIGNIRTKVEHILVSTATGRCRLFCGFFLIPDFPLFVTTVS